MKARQVNLLTVNWLIGSILPNIRLLAGYKLYLIDKITKGDGRRNVGCMKKQGLVVFFIALVIGVGVGYGLLLWLTPASSSDLFSIIPATVEPTPTPDTSPRRVKLNTADSVSLAAIYYPPARENAKVLILLHEAYKGKEMWHDFAQDAQNAGYGVLAFDLRGHGRSGGQKTFDETMDHDVETALEWVRSRPELNQEQIGMAGASLGANLALRAGARHPEIKSLVLLSPGMSLWELGIEDAIAGYGARPMMLVTSEEDTYPRETVQNLSEMIANNYEVKVFPGTAHGAQLIKDYPELTQLMLDWFAESLSP